MRSTVLSGAGIPPMAEVRLCTVRSPTWGPAGGPTEIGRCALSQATHKRTVTAGQRRWGLPYDVTASASPRTVPVSKGHAQKGVGPLHGHK
jgi:hypothetical protein